ncbi:metalloregulator ArsR/SmtB family transcription factor [Chloroflexota bacterium]
MDNQLQFNELLNFFKTLSDANRLKIIGLLAQEPLSVEQMAEMLDLHSSTVSHHLAKLSKAKLVSAHTESYYSVYQLEEKNLETMAKRLLARETLPAVASNVDIDAYDRKVLNTYMTPEGRFNRFPHQLKKVQAILRYVIHEFEVGVRYSEKQVNEILSKFSEDTAYLRRYLVEYGFMKRQGGGGEYWREET